MSVYKPENSRYWHYDFQFKRRRFHGSTGQTTRRAAERFEEAERRKLADGGGVSTAQPITLDDAIGTYTANRLTGRPDARNAMGRGPRLLAEFGAGTFLSEIRAADVAAFAARRRAKVADSTTNRDLEFMRRVWNYARDELERDVGKPIPWGKLKYPEPEERTRELQPTEELALFEHLRADLHDFMRFAMIRGLRREALRTLRWQDVDLAAGTISYTLKASGRAKAKRVTKPLTPDELTILRRQPRVDLVPYVFTYVCEHARHVAKGQGGRAETRIKGRRYPLTGTVIQKAMEAARKGAGIDDLRFHDATRHTAATRLVRAAGNLKLAQKMLDHTNIRTTARYAHATEDDLLDAMTAMQAPVDVTETKQRA